MVNRTRKFDWDEAKRLYDKGAQIEAIAYRLGVTMAAVERVVLPGRFEKSTANSNRYQAKQAGAATCIDCGAPIHAATERYGRGRCRPCATKESTISVRETELRCSHCKQWKPDDQFYRSTQKAQAHRRGRSGLCKECNDAARQRHREKLKLKKAAIPEVPFWRP